MKKRIHIFGASGAGTSTLAKALCKKLGATHLDTDDFFWEKTNPPYTIERSVEKRIELIQQKISGNTNWILSGSLCGWGDVFIPHFDLVIFLYLPPEIRLERLKKREFERYGTQILQGGKLHSKSQEFLEWAALYDTNTTQTNRTLQKHLKWLEDFDFPVLKIEGNIKLEHSVSLAMAKIQRVYN